MAGFIAFETEVNLKNSVMFTLLLLIANTADFCWLAYFLPGHKAVTRVRRKPTGVPSDDEEPITGSAMGTDKCPHDCAGIGAMVSALV